MRRRESGPVRGPSSKIQNGFFRRAVLRRPKPNRKPKHPGLAVGLGVRKSKIRNEFSKPKSERKPNFGGRVVGQGRFRPGPASSGNVRLSEALGRNTGVRKSLVRAK